MSSSFVFLVAIFLSSSTMSSGDADIADTSRRPRTPVSGGHPATGDDVYISLYDIWLHHATAPSRSTRECWLLCRGRPISPSGQGCSALSDWRWSREAGQAILWMR